MMNKWPEWLQTGGGRMAAGFVGGLLAASVATAGDEQRHEVQDADPRHEVEDAEPRTDRDRPDDETRHGGQESEQRHEVEDAEPRREVEDAEPRD